ncbi:hypothetical protein [Aeromonas rivipollensis]|uniref:hypothetical protein n=1 Tax=Aeromonas rivipollensis TaxID=948519 RepID=UPI00259F8D11|nr:hypothetical protein [Aeromonas rivipollensis]MDM5121874.1 hypothetical protein [Aeromonas rivipollensis]
MERLGGIPSGLFVLATIKYVALPLQTALILSSRFMQNANENSYHFMHRQGMDDENEDVGAAVLLADRPVGLCRR